MIGMIRRSEGSIPVTTLLTADAPVLANSRCYLKRLAHSNARKTRYFDDALATRSTGRCFNYVGDKKLRPANSGRGVRDVERCGARSQRAGTAGGHRRHHAGVQHRPDGAMGVSKSTYVFVDMAPDRQGLWRCRLRAEHRPSRRRWWCGGDVAAARR